MVQLYPDLSCESHVTSRGTWCRSTCQGSTIKLAQPRFSKVSFAENDKIDNNFTTILRLSQDAEVAKLRLVVCTVKQTEVLAHSSTLAEMPDRAGHDAEGETEMDGLYINDFQKRLIMFNPSWIIC